MGILHEKERISSAICLEVRSTATKNRKIQWVDDSEDVKSSVLVLRYKPIETLNPLLERFWSLGVIDVEVIKS